LSSALHRGGREIDRDDVVPRFGEGAHFVTSRNRISTRCPRGSAFRNCASAAGTPPASQGVKFSRNRFSQNSNRAGSSLGVRSAFDTDHLLERMDDID
jgi:hypothetical protein